MGFARSMERYWQLTCHWRLRGRDRRLMLRPSLRPCPPPHLPHTVPALPTLPPLQLGAWEQGCQVSSDPAAQLTVSCFCSSTPLSFRSWVFGSEGVTALVDESLSGAAWEILYNAINKTIARVQVGKGGVATVHAGSALCRSCR